MFLKCWFLWLNRALTNKRFGSDRTSTKIKGMHLPFPIPMRRGATISGNMSDFMSGADTQCPKISSGDTSWMMAATAFVLFMTVLFYLKLGCAHDLPVILAAQGN